MIGQIEILHMAQQLAEHAAARQSVVAKNIAHADTPGFRQQDVQSFSETYRNTDAVSDMRATRRGHFGKMEASAMPVAFEVEGGTVKPNGNNVSLENEILKSAEIKQQHDMALSIYRSGLGIVRASLGRR